MDPTARNRVLLIGGALIVIALLLVCGPLEGRFGGGRPGIDAVETPPDMAAAPPVREEPVIDSTSAIEAETTRELTDAAIGESDLTDPLEAEPVEALPVVPPPVSPPVKVAKATAPTVARAVETPPVSAAGPEVKAPPLVVVPTVDERATSVAEDFDSSLADMTNALDRDDASVVGRFAPPVDSGPRVALAARGINSFALRPCDNPGSGCQNVQPRQRARPTPAAGGSVIPSR